MPTPTPSVDALIALRDASIAQLLLRAARRLDEEAVARIAARPGMGNLRRAHTALLPHIGFDGTRPSAIAAQLGVTRQAVGQLVDDLEEFGIVERIDDPTDARAKRVRFTPAGRSAMVDGLEVLGRLMDECLQGVDDADRQTVLRVLQQLNARLDR